MIDLKQMKSLWSSRNELEDYDETWPQFDNLSQRVRLRLQKGRGKGEHRSPATEVRASSLDGLLSF